MLDMNLQNAFGRADRAFEEKVYGTLSRLRRGGSGRVRAGSRVRFAAVFAVICALAVTTAAAAVLNPLGIFDFLRERERDAVLPAAAALVTYPEASEVIAYPEASGIEASVTFSVRELLYDGETVFLAVAVTPPDENTLLLGSDSDLGEPMASLGPLFAEDMTPVREYAAAHGKIPFHTNVNIDHAASGIGHSSLDFRLEEDGTLVYMIRAGWENADGELPLVCVTMAYTDEGRLDETTLTRRTFSVTVADAALNPTAASAEPAVYEKIGVRIDKITLTGTPMATYAKIEYTVIDPDTYAAVMEDNALAFEFLGGDGNALPPGVTDSGGYSEPPEGSARVQYRNFAASEALPETVAVRGFNIWDKTRYETREFEMR